MRLHPLSSVAPLPFSILLAACLGTAPASAQPLPASAQPAAASAQPPPPASAQLAAEEAPPPATARPEAFAPGEAVTPEAMAHGETVTPPEALGAGDAADPMATEHESAVPNADDDDADDEDEDDAPASVPWYQRLNIRGYTQIRYNRLPSFDRNDDLINRQGDRSIGAGNGFLIRRARVILYGDLHERISVYLQPDFASSIGDQQHVVIMRDWYTDIFFDRNREFRLRVGQSKVPYGFENLQSSQNRLAFDRNDALNSAVKDERDLGVFFYWSPTLMRERFMHLVSSGLKGSGDYGMLALGVYNGQTANVPAGVDDLHVIGRLSVPFMLGRQYFEVGGGGYYGRFRIRLEDRQDFTYSVPNGDPLLLDARAFATFVMYPQPFGIMAEYTAGVGPQQGEADPSLIDSRRLHGGYLQLMLKIDEPFGTVALIPYARLTYYEGGKKFFTNAPRYDIREIELGVEWQILRQLEITLAYNISDRTSDVFPYIQQQGHNTRVQVQVNY